MLVEFTVLLDYPVDQIRQFIEIPELIAKLKIVAQFLFYKT